MFVNVCFKPVILQKDCLMTLIYCRYHLISEIRYVFLLRVFQPIHVFLMLLRTHVFQSSINFSIIDFNVRLILVKKI